MADYEITADDTYGGLDPDEVKSWSLRDFLAAMLRSNSCAVIKFWSLVSQMPDADLRVAAKVLIADITKKQDRVQLVEDIRRTDADTGTHTDLTDCF